MVLVLMAVIVFVAIFIVGYPLANPERYEYAEGESNGNDALEHLAVARNSIFEAIRDLEFDRATGKLSDHDYGQLRARYDVQAAQILQQIDNAAAVQAKSSRADKAHTQKVSAGKDACPRCHQRLLASDRFCPTCGTRLG